MIFSILVATLAFADVLTSQSITDAHEFYPIHIGDTWTYESSIRGQFTNQVVDSLVTEGSVIFHVRSTDSEGRQQMLMVRRDGPRVFLGTEPESLALLADFSLKVGESTPTRMGNQEATLTLAARHESLDVFGGLFEDVVEMHVMPRSGSGVTYYFARGVGLVGMESTHPKAQVHLIQGTVGGRPITAREH